MASRTGRGKATAGYLGTGASVPNPKVTPGRSPLASAKNAKASKPPVPKAPKAFAGVKTPKRSATSKSTKPGRLRRAPKGTALTPNA